tara:strand:+ start:65 stop:538 length:474 start_codon:yes stop_codon:yes gene_type:complete
MQKQITISQILEDLENGMTRTPSDKKYNSERGSIMEKYSLTKFEVILLFKNEKLKGKKTKQPRQLSFVLVDDTENIVEESLSETYTAADTKEQIADESRNIETATNSVINVEQPAEETTNVVSFTLVEEVEEHFNNIHDATVTPEVVEEENNDQLGW